MTDPSQVIIWGQNGPDNEFTMWMRCGSCPAPWPAFEGAGVVPRLSDMIRQAESHDCTKTRQP